MGPLLKAFGLALAVAVIGWTVVGFLGLLFTQLPLPVAATIIVVIWLTLLIWSISTDRMDDY
jgi:hypothetical protein